MSGRARGRDLCQIAFGLFVSQVLPGQRSQPHIHSLSLDRAMRPSTIPQHLAPAKVPVRLRPIIGSPAAARGVSCSMTAPCENRTVGDQPAHSCDVPGRTGGAVRWCRLSSPPDRMYWAATASLTSAAIRLSLAIFDETSSRVRCRRAIFDETPTRSRLIEVVVVQVAALHYVNSTETGHKQATALRSCQRASPMQSRVREWCRGWEHDALGSS
jgi:hypothetical protein